MAAAQWVVLCLTFSNNYLTELEKDQVKPIKSKFYNRIVYDMKCRRLKNMHDSLSDNLNQSTKDPRYSTFIGEYHKN